MQVALSRAARVCVPFTVLLAIAAQPTPAGATWPGVNGRVSLTQRVPIGPLATRANRDIFAYGLDGEATRARITSTTDNEEQSSWSPDGQWIAYKRRDSVYVTRWDGTLTRTLTAAATGVNNTQPAWSPDATRIVFRSNREYAPANVADIWVMNAADGADQQALMRRAGDERYPSFSPDGTRLAFRGDADGVDSSGDEEIFVANADGTGVTPLTNDTVSDSAPAWSPDGARLAFESNRDGADREIYVMDADGTNVVRLTDNDIHDEGPAWSPDGRFIAFTRADTPTSAGDVWVMNADGSGQRVLSQTDIIEESPDWQPVPVSIGTRRHRARACGDISVLPGGVQSIETAGLPCFAAAFVAARWERRTEGGAGASWILGLRCTATPHSFDQSLVECRLGHTPLGVAFIHRDPPPLSG